MTTKQIWEIDDYNRIIDGTTKVLLFTVDTSSDDDPLPIMRKIAAAPAMYEALSRLRNVASTASNHMRLSGNEEEALLFDNDQRVVEAALAQAEGAQHE